MIEKTTMALDFRTCKMPQQYVDPATGKKLIKEINIAMQDFRLDTSNEVSIKPYIAVYVENFGEMLYVDPAPVLQPLIDASRTNCPRNCYQTYLVDMIDASSDYIWTHSNDNLNAKIGDPVAIMDDLDGTNISYHIISNLDKDWIQLTGSVGRNYFKGAFIQNLSNRWWGQQLGKNEVGIKTKMEMIEKPFFKAIFKDGLLKIAVQAMIGKTSAKFYDVYVRKNSFSCIQPHWIPDVEDQDVSKNMCQCNTYSGGEKCGGGILDNKETYYVAVVYKDIRGRVGVRESSISTEEIKNQNS